METLFFLGILGLIFGSFITSLTYQVARADFSWAKLWRRSKCPKCMHALSWQDNIPLISYIVLGGKCRKCKKRISLRYPLIEIITVSIFLSLHIGSAGMIPLPMWDRGDLTLPYLLFLTVGLLSIAIVDFEHQIIPDKILFPLITIHLSLITIFSPSPTLFINFLWAAAAAVFFLFLCFVTRGRGMGLGDVKLAFLIGLIAGGYTWLAIFIAFIVGSVIGIFLVIARQAHFGKPIPFGPFLVAGTFITLLWGEQISGLLIGGTI